jgi:hypothetical protein
MKIAICRQNDITIMTVKIMNITVARPVMDIDIAIPPSESCGTQRGEVKLQSSIVLAISVRIAALLALSTNYIQYDGNCSSTE